MIIKNAEFVVSIAKKQDLKDFGMPEFAFVGRSNVGKSSLINALTNRKKLAKASSTPGRTRLINYFKINNSFMFVDLPGYGYALAGKEEQAKWQELIGAYLENSKQLKRVFVLVDIRHEPNERDKIMLNYLFYYNIPFNVIATKADKISKAQIEKQKTLIANTLEVGRDDIVVVSANEKRGIDNVLDIIESLM